MYYSSYDSPYNAYTLNPMEPIPRVDPYCDDALPTSPNVNDPDAGATQPTQLNSQAYATESSEDLWGCLMPLSTQDDAERINLYRNFPCVTIGRSRNNHYQLGDIHVSEYHALNSSTFDLRCLWRA